MIREPGGHGNDERQAENCAQGQACTTQSRDTHWNITNGHVLRLHSQGTPHPWGEKKKADEKDDTSPRAERPPIETDFPERPDECACDHEGEDPQSHGPRSDKAISCDEKAEACKEIIPGAAELDQPDAASCQP
jgi:hypothetical protein